jgi:hypothetical protein
MKEINGVDGVDKVQSGLTQNNNGLHQCNQFGTERYRVILKISFVLAYLVHLLMSNYKSFIAEKNMESKAKRKPQVHLVKLWAGPF